MKERPAKRKLETSPGCQANPETPALPAQATRRWFRFAAVLSPLALLLLAEVILRVAGFGNSTSFFLGIVQNGEPRLIENPRFGWRFFPPSLARSPLPVSLAAAKPAGTLRVFILGESAAMGDPEPAYGMARQLERLLQARHPESKIEVVNLAMTAINSHVLREIAGDCTRAGGDCWVIYAGNNEVVGPFGAGTVFGKQAPVLATVRLNLALKRTRIGQALARIGGRRGQPQEWLGMEMFLHQEVHEKDPRLARVYDNFARNLEAVIDCGKRSNAKVVAATMPVNLRDCPPFGSGHREGLSVEQTAEWQRYFESGRAAERESRFSDAVIAYDGAVRIDPDFAEVFYRRAVCKLAGSDPEGAKADFLLARDLDTLRFRADSYLNEAVRRVAAEKAVTLVDAEVEISRGLLAGNPSAGPTSRVAASIPGEELFYDHVHLNFAGNYWLARLLLPVVERELFGSASAGAGAVLSAQEVAARLAWTEFDQKKVFEEMRARLRQPPFSSQSNFQKRDASWQQRLTGLTGPASAGAAHYASALRFAPGDWVLHARFAHLLEALGDHRGAAAHWQEVAKLLPDEPEAFYQLGNLAQNRGAYAEAESLYRDSFQKRPESTETLNGLGLVARAQGRTKEALQWFESALRLEPSSAATRINLAVLLAESGRVKEAKAEYSVLLKADTNNLAARINLAKLLAEEGAMDQAIRLYEEAVKLQPESAIGHYNLANALSAQHRYPEALLHYEAAIRARPEFPEARYNLGLELARVSRVPEAAAQFAEVIRLQPGHVEAHLNYGVALAKQQRYSEAVREFKVTLSLQPGHPSAGPLLERASAMAQREGL